MYFHRLKFMFQNSLFDALVITVMLLAKLFVTLRALTNMFLANVATAELALVAGLGIALALANDAGERLRCDTHV